MDEPVMPLRYFLKQEDYLSAPPEEQLSRLDDLFTKAGNLASTDEESGKLHAAQLQLRGDLLKRKFQTELLGSLPEELRTEENFNFLSRKYLKDWQVIKSGDTTEVQPARLTPLTEDELTQFTARAQRGESLPEILMPSEKARISGRLEAAGLDVQALNLRSVYDDESGVSSAGQDNISRRAYIKKLGFASGSLREMEEMQNDVYSTKNWTPIADDRGELMKYRRKPGVHGSNVWEFNLISGGKRETKTHDFGDKRPDNASIRDVIVSIAHQDADFWSTDTRFQDGSQVPSDWHRMQALVGRKDANYLRAAEAGIFGSGGIGGLMSQAGHLMADEEDLEESGRSKESGFLAFLGLGSSGAGLMDRFGGMLIQDAKNADVVGASTRASMLKRGGAPIDEMFQQGVAGPDAWTMEGSDLVRKLTGTASHVASMFFMGPMRYAGVAAGGMAGEASHNTYQELKTRMDLNKAAWLATEEGALSGMVTFGLTALTGKLITENSLASESIRKAISSRMTGIAAKGGWRQWAATAGTNFASALPGDLAVNVIGGAVNRTATTFIGELVRGEHDLGKALEGLKKSFGEDWDRNIFAQGLIDDAAFAGFGAALFGNTSPRGRAQFQSGLPGTPVITQHAPPDLRYQVLDAAGGQKAIQFGRHVARFKSSEEAEMFRQELLDFEDLTADMFTHGERGLEPKEDVTPEQLVDWQERSTKVGRRMDAVRGVSIKNDDPDVISSHDTIADAMDEVRSLSQRLVIDPKKQPTQQREDFVNQLTDIYAGRDRDWQAEHNQKVSNLLAQPKRDAEVENLTTKNAEIQNKLNAISDKGSREAQKMTQEWADNNTRLDRLSKQKSKMSPRDAEAAAKRLIEAQQQGARVAHQRKAETQADVVFGAPVEPIAGIEIDSPLLAPEATAINRQFAVDQTTQTFDDGTTSTRWSIRFKNEITSESVTARDEKMVADAEAATAQAEQQSTLERMVTNFANDETGATSGRTRSKGKSRTAQESFEAEARPAGDPLLPARPAIEGLDLSAIPLRQVIEEGLVMADPVSPIEAVARVDAVLDNPDPVIAEAQKAVAAPKKKAKSKPSIIDLTGMGSAAVDNLYIRIWDDAKKGNLGPKPPLAEQVVKAAHDRGLVQTLDDVKKFARMSRDEALAFFKKDETTDPVVLKAQEPKPADPSTGPVVEDSGGGTVKVTDADGTVSYRDAPQPIVDSGDLIRGLELLNKENRISISLLQRILKLGYTRAQGLKELMIQRGFIDTEGNALRETPEAAPGLKQSPEAKARPGKSGQTILFSELAKLGLKAIRAGQNFAQWAGEMAKQFGDKFNQAFRDVWRALAGSVGRQVALAGQSATSPQSARGTPLASVRRPSQALNSMADSPNTARLARIRGTTISPNQAAHNLSVDQRRVELMRLGKFDLKEGGFPDRAMKWIDGHISNPLSELGRIHPILRTALSFFEYTFAGRHIRYKTATEDLTRGFDKFSREDDMKLTIAQSIGDSTTRTALLQKYSTKDNDLVKAWAMWEDVRDVIAADAEQSGVKFGFVEDYLPRTAKDWEGLVNALRASGSETWGIINKAMSKAQKALGEGGVLTAEQRREVVNSVLAKSFQARGPGSNLKSRKLTEVTVDTAPFYDTNAKAMRDYVFRMARDSSIAEFFGQDAQSQIDSGGVNDSLPLDRHSSIGTVVHDLMTEGQISGREQRQIHKILADRLGFIPTSKWLQNAKAGNILFAMNSPIRALGQLQELGLSALNNGHFNTLTALGGSTVLNPKRWTLNDIGVQPALHLTDPGLNIGAALNQAAAFVFTASGYKALDGMTASAVMGAYVKKLNAMTPEQTAKTLRPMQRFLTNTAESVAADIRAGRKTEDAKFVLFNHLSGIRPVSLSNMPRAYLKGGSANRMLYNLKIFQLHQLDHIRNASFGEIGKGNVAKGVGNLINMGFVLTMAGAGIDEVKDWILGRERNLSHHVANNVMKLVMFSTYQGDKLAEGEIFGTLANFANLPLFGVMEEGMRQSVKAKKNADIGDPWWKDLEKSKMLEYIPTEGVGSYYYWRHSGASAEKNFNYMTADYSDAVEDARSRLTLLKSAGPDKREKNNLEVEYENLRYFDAIRRHTEREMKEEIKAGNMAAASDWVSQLSRIASKPDSWRGEYNLLE